jgi:hypothetical protein
MVLTWISKINSVRFIAKLRGDEFGNLLVPQFLRLSSQSNLSVLGMVTPKHTVPWAQLMDESKSIGFGDLLDLW